MAAMFGADVDALRTTSDVFEQRADDLDHIVTTISGAIDSTRWTGSDATTFTGWWHATGAVICQRSADLLRTGADGLRRDADEQEAASTTNGSQVGAGAAAGAGVRPEPLWSEPAKKWGDGDDDADGGGWWNWDDVNPANALKGALSGGQSGFGGNPFTALGTTLLGGFIGGVPGDGLIEDVAGPEHGPGASGFWDDTALTRASLGLLPPLGVGIGALDVVDGFSEQVEGGVRGDPIRSGLGRLQSTLGLGSLIGTRYPTVGVASSAGSFALTGAKELAENFEPNPLNWF